MRGRTRLAGGGPNSKKERWLTSIALVESFFLIAALKKPVRLFLMVGLDIFVVGQILFMVGWFFLWLGMVWEGWGGLRMVHQKQKQHQTPGRIIWTDLNIEIRLYAELTHRLCVKVTMYLHHP